MVLNSFPKIFFIIHTLLMSYRFYSWK